MKDRTDASPVAEAEPGENPDRRFEERSPLEQLRAVVAMLRDSEFGCPWDLEQSLRSLIPFTLEEAYEVVDAIERDDMVGLEDELGDLLFQVAFYAQIANEDGLFDFDDVASAITRKLIRRHPHVFPDQDVSRFGKRQDISAEQVVVNWEQIKQAEREEKAARRGDSAEAEDNSALADVPRALPALERARKLQKRAARHGFDWQNLQPVIAKLKEEIGEFEEAISRGDKDAQLAEMGDILFATVNLARHTKLEPEIALRGANDRFEQRFRWIEAALAARQKQLKDVDLQELDALWEDAKAQGL